MSLGTHDDDCRVTKVYRKVCKEMKLYRKKLIQPMRPYIVGENMAKISVWAGDTLEPGGMIAVNPDDDDDKWYVDKQFFEENYEEVG